MQLHLSRVLVASLCLSQAHHASPDNRETELVSYTSTGAQPTFRSNFPVASTDGSVIAFESSADDLVPGDTNFSRDIFVRDRIAGTTTRVSVSSSGVQGDHHSYNPSISADGNYVVFHSKASNFVSGDSFGGFLDVFVHDRTAGTTTLVSVSTAGTVGGGHSYDASITPDGSQVAFYSSASDLVAGDANGSSDVFVRTLATGTNTLISVSSAGVQGDNNSLDAAFSANGRIVTFSSLATNLTPDDMNGAQDVFVHDRVTGLTTRISESTSGDEGNSFSRIPRISSDGRFVVFESLANTLVPDDTNFEEDVFLHDRTTGVTSIVSVDSNGNLGDGGSGHPSISFDGTRIVFHSWSTNFAGDVAGLDVFVHDTTSATTRLVSVDSLGVPGNNHSIDPEISPDGRFVVFQSGADNLVAGDVNGYEDIFLHDSLGAATVTTRNAGANPASYTAGTPVLGTLWTADVDLTTTGHGLGQVFGYIAPTSLALGGGQVLLVGGAKVFQLPLRAGPLASWSVLLPNDTSLAGLRLFTQAAHLSGVTPFALSNAQDLCLGY